MKTFLVKDNFNNRVYQADGDNKEEVLDYYACELDCLEEDLEIEEIKK